nr:MAG: hypothetical protein [Bacteriophage sp.]
MAIHGLRLGLSFNLYTDPKPFGNFINIILLVKMSTKITASERVFRLQDRSEDDTIFLRNEVSLRRSTTVPVLAYWGGFYLF